MVIPPTASYRYHAQSNWISYVAYKQFFWATCRVRILLNDQKCLVLQQLQNNNIVFTVLCSNMSIGLANFKVTEKTNVP